MFNHILLCTHGSDGAQKAERFVFKKKDENPGLKITVLTVLDEDWRSMTGDDWLNSSRTHAAFLDHVEHQVSQEIQEEWQRILAGYPAAAGAEFLQRTGHIARTITGVARELGCDLIALGPCREKKGLMTGRTGKGLQDTLKNKVLHPLLPCPLIIAP